MKHFIIAIFFISLFSCSERQEVMEDKKVDKADSISEYKAQTLTDEEVKLKYSTYVVVEDRIFAFHGKKKYVKMKTRIVNKTDIDIHCIKGWLVVKDDLTDMEFCTFYVDCPKDIPKNGEIEFITTEYECDPEGIPMHKRLLEMGTIEFNSWITCEVEKITFADNTILESKTKRKKVDDE